MPALRFMDSYVKEALQQALRSNQKHLHGCVIINNEDGKIVAKGYNFISGKPLKDTFSIHAEMHALSRLGKKFRNCSMIVARLRDADSLVPKFSMPCQVCRRLILRHPVIKKVYFTSSNNS